MHASDASTTCLLSATLVLSAAGSAVSWLMQALGSQEGATQALHRRGASGYQRVQSVTALRPTLGHNIHVMYVKGLNSCNRLSKASDTSTLEGFPTAHSHCVCSPLKSGRVAPSARALLSAVRTLGPHSGRCPGVAHRHATHVSLTPPTPHPTPHPCGTDTNLGTSVGGEKQKLPGSEKNPPPHPTPPCNRARSPPHCTH